MSTEGTPLSPVDKATPEVIQAIRVTDSQIARVKKRIIVCCDGTWQDGIVLKDRYRYTNILKISRAINREDIRTHPAIPQIVYYQAGIGSENNFYAEWVEGATGASLGEKVQEAYGFVANNYQPGDELFLFGFSRGAYTARMIAGIIGVIGVLNRTDMDHFAEIFINLQKRGKATEPKDIEELDKLLEPWTNPAADGRKRADPDKNKYTIKVVGVFDTVGSLGLPGELVIGRPKTTEVFGFPDLQLGLHIEYAFHAMALNETRADFNVAKFEQTKAGLEKGQTLKQCWFSGEHSDIGGGWQDHDLSDISLTWMLSNVAKFLAIDETYVKSLPVPVAPWGKQQPHNSRTGIFSLAESLHRDVADVTDEVTHEVIHPSVLQQDELHERIKAKLQSNPQLVTELHPIEEQERDLWPYVPGKNPVHAEGGIDAATTTSDSEATHGLHEFFNKIKIGVEDIVHGATHKKVMKDQQGDDHYQRNWLGSFAAEHSMGKLLLELTKSKD